MALWGRYLWETESLNAFYFPLDAEDRIGVMRDCLEFCGVEYKEFPWRPVGRSNRDRSLTIPDHMLENLRFAYEWYETHTTTTPTANSLRAFNGG